MSRAKNHPKQRFCKNFCYVLRGRIKDICILSYISKFSGTEMHSAAKYTHSNHFADHRGQVLHLPPVLSLVSCRIVYSWQPQGFAPTFIPLYLLKPGLFLILSFIYKINECLYLSSRFGGDDNREKFNAPPTCYS